MASEPSNTDAGDDDRFPLMVFKVDFGIDNGADYYNLISIGGSIFLDEKAVKKDEGDCELGIDVRMRLMIFCERELVGFLVGRAVICCRKIQ